MGLAVPALQSPLVGLALAATPLAAPQAPLVALVARLAWHMAVAPPDDPAQDHVQGPLPETAEASPTLQRLVLGAVENAALFEVPQTPATGAPPTAKLALA